MRLFPPLNNPFSLTWKWMKIPMRIDYESLLVTLLLLLFVVTVGAIEFSYIGIYTESLLLENINLKVIALVVEIVAVAYLLLAISDIVFSSTRWQALKANGIYIELGIVTLVFVIIMKEWAVGYYKGTDLKFAACGFYQSGCIIIREYRKP